MVTAILPNQFNCPFYINKKTPILSVLKFGTQSARKKPPRFPGAAFELPEAAYFFFALRAGFFAFPPALVARFSSIAAWAAARRATGTRYGEQLT